MTEEKRRRTILIVDDEPAIRELLKVQLAGEGYEVVMAEDARSAARLVREAKPDLMIVDAHMPYVSGLDFVSAVIVDSSMPWVPVIFITGRSEPAQRRRSARLGLPGEAFPHRAPHRARGARPALAGAPLRRRRHRP